MKHDEKKIEEITGKLPLHNDMLNNSEIEDSMKQYAEHMIQQERKKFISNLIEREEENLELLKEEFNLINQHHE